MATVGFGFAEAYVTQKLYKEKMKRRAQEEGDKNTDMDIPTIKTSSKNKTPSGCFSWVSKHQHSKISRISDYNHAEAVPDVLSTLVIRTKVVGPFGSILPIAPPSKT
ncbi:hypothetical protein CR513_43793, partial [Mucuna pruriens]